MKIISVRENQGYKDIAIRYLQDSWPDVYPAIYENCISNCIDAENDLPQWYLLKKNEEIIGCAGLVTNDFISRMDLYPWICAVFISEKERDNNYAKLLIEKAKSDSVKFGFKHLNLSTSLTGYYEKFGFSYIGQGYHPWEEESCIYQIKL